MTTVHQTRDDRNLKDHWVWMLGNATDDDMDTQPDGPRWVTTEDPHSAPTIALIVDHDGNTTKWHEPTCEDISFLAQFDAERCEERVALMVRYPLTYEPADIDADEQFAVTGDDLAYQRGFSCGYDGHLASPPDGLTEDEAAAWRDGWATGYYSYIDELERDYELGHPDPDPWNEVRSPLAGHPAEEN